MDIVSFVTKLGEKFAPVDAGVVKTLQIQLTDDFNRILENYRAKKERNRIMAIEFERMSDELDRANEAGKVEEGKDIAYRMQEVKKGVEKPTLVELACAFFDRPWVKLALLLSFGIVSALIARRLVGRKKEDEEGGYPDGGQDGAGSPPPYGYPPYPPYPYAPYGNGRRNDYGRK